MVTGWGRTTNNVKAADKKLVKDGVASKKLRSAKVPIANAKCAEFDIDEKLQICAGGDDGKFYYFSSLTLYNILFQNRYI